MVGEIKKDLRIYNNASMLLFGITIFVRKRVASHSCPFTRSIRASSLSPPPHSLHSIFSSVLFYSPFCFFFLFFNLITSFHVCSAQEKHERVRIRGKSISLFKFYDTHHSNFHKWTPVKKKNP